MAFLTYLITRCIVVSANALAKAISHIELSEFKYITIYALIGCNASFAGVMAPTAHWILVVIEVSIQTFAF
jgi:hypothetical protein